MYVVYVVFAADVWLYLFSSDGSIPGVSVPQYTQSYQNIMITHLLLDSLSIV